MCTIVHARARGRPAAISLNGIAAAILKPFRTHSSATVKFGAAHRSALFLLALSVLTFHTQHTESAVRRVNPHVPMYRESLSFICSRPRHM